MENAILEINEITKTFPGVEAPVVANDKVSLSIGKNEIHAIVGENGTGKSTLMNILYGLCQPDSGSIRLHGKRIQIGSPRDAIAAGIGMVHQHFMLAPSFTVAENLVFAFEPCKYGAFVDRAEAIRLTKEISERFGLYVEPTRKIMDCTLSMQQRVEILKILLRGAEILIFDEPTAVLTPNEAEELFHAFRELKKAGKSIIFISHKLREVISVADRITVMRKGRVVESVDCGNTSMENLAELMVGRHVSVGTRLVENGAQQEDGKAIISWSNVSTAINASGKRLANIDLCVREGEIVGVAGVGGNGQDIIVETAAGLSKDITEGSMQYHDTNVTRFDACAMRKIGIAHITGDRYKRGISNVSSIYENLIMGAHQRAPYAGRLFYRPKKLKELSNRLIEEYSIKTPSCDTDIMSLSGGNIQKCILAREMNLAKELIIAEEPTRGVDVGSQSFIYDMLIRFAKKGYGVLLVSTDLDEILSLSNRVCVMFEGRIVGFVDPESPDARTRIGRLMAGLSDESGEPSEESGRKVSDHEE